MGILLILLVFALVAAMIGLSSYHFRKMREEGYAKSRTRYIVLFAASLLVAILILILVLWQFN
jgi:hypothetical protein